MKKMILYFFILVLLVSCVLGFYDHATNVYDSGTKITNGNLRILIYESASGGSAIYDNTFSGVINSGIWSVQVNAGLEYGKTYYKDYEINGVDIDFDGSERLAFISKEGSINSSWINVTNSILYVNDTTERVGIGTTEPYQKLSVGKTTDNSNAIQIMTSNIGTGYFYFSDLESDSAAELKYDHSSDFFSLNTAGSSRFCINSLGRVGVGTVNPQYKLDINGSVALNNTLFVDEIGNVGIGTAGPEKMLHIGGESTGSTMRLEGLTGTSWSYDFDTTQGNYLLIQSGKSEASEFVIDRDGNVGIGTTTPDTKLHVSDGNFLLDSGIFFGEIENGSRIYNYPPQKSMDIVSGWGNGADKIRFGVAFPSGAWQTKMVLNASQLAIYSGVNVGIGTTTPDTKLHVDGLMKLTPTDSPSDCSAVGEGSIYFDDSLNKPCFCDGTNWQQFDGGGICS